MNVYDDVSILDDIKQSLDGISEDDTAFDPNILLQINAAISRLNQLGIGPKGGFIVSDSSFTWSDLETDPVAQGLSRQFILYSVKIGFDPPDSSFVLNSLKEMRKELEFSLVVEHDRMVSENGI